MYRYDLYDRTLVTHRAGEFRAQVRRRLDGELSEDQFRPLRLMNGVYLQLHSYMLRVAIPYGTLGSRQLRRLAEIARHYDRGIGHLTTRQNMQFNWPKLTDVPDILDHLARVDLHAIQTSGNCIRNVTTDPFAGVAADEWEDPRVYCELIRQWSTFHPEFSFLPRKFKVAVTGAATDRAAVRLHDIGLRLIPAPEAGPGGADSGFEVIVGGGQGRTPLLGHTIRAFLPRGELLSYLEAILRVYNRFGRRDNKYRARIKVLVHDVGPEAFAAMVEEEWQAVRTGEPSLTDDDIARVRDAFALPYRASGPSWSATLDRALVRDEAFRRWFEVNVTPHRHADRAIVTLPIKHGGIPGDVDADQMDLIAGLADRYSHGEIRVTYQQNLVLPHVRREQLPALWSILEPAGLALPIAGLAADVIACPGMDYCALATARSVPVARDIGLRFRDPARARLIGELRINVSGCINACGHHHAGHIGILGVDKRGEEFYQITVGGSGSDDAAIGTLIGPALPAAQVADAVETLVHVALALRQPGERFLETWRRVGPAPFKEALYGAPESRGAGEAS